MATEIKNQPIDTLRDGALKAVIWKNSSPKGDFYTAEFSRTYKTDEGYHDSRSFSSNDLLKLHQLAQQTYLRIGELRRQGAQQPESEATTA